MGGGGGGKGGAPSGESVAAANSVNFGAAAGAVDPGQAALAPAASSSWGLTPQQGQMGMDLLGRAQASGGGPFGAVPAVSMPEGQLQTGSVALHPLRFPLTPRQSQLLPTMDPEMSRRFILNQILSGNMTYGPYSPEQVQAAIAIQGGR